MKRFLKNSKKLEHKHLLEIAASCAGAMLLIFAALFISNGGLKNIHGELSYLQHINPETLTATIFPCNYFGYCYAPITLNISMSVSNASPTPGSTVTAYSSISVSGANAYCSESVWGGEYGAGPGSGIGGDPVCTCVGGDEDGSIVACGQGGSECDSTVPAGNTGTTGIGSTYGGSATHPWTPLPFAQAGTTYTVYTSCTAANVGYVQAAASATITPVAAPTDNCPATPNPVANGLQVPPGTYHVVAQGNDFCVTNNSGQYLFVPASSATEVSYFRSATQGYLAGTVAYFARATGY